MNVLWLCGNDSPYTYKKGCNRTTDGSWMESLMKALECNFPSIQLSIAYMSTHQENLNEEIGGIKFFSLKVSAKDKLLGKWRTKLYNRYDHILKHAKPDLIQVFGSETELGLIYKNTNTPIVLHIQGILNNYIRHWYPYRYNSGKEIFEGFPNLLHFIKSLFFKKIRTLSLSNEREILSNIHYYLGRTDWDYAVTKEFSPNCKYFVCNEALRPAFENAEELWKWNANRPLRLVSIMSNAVYKGLDTILYTARILKERYKLDFEWHVVGISETNIAEKITQIKANSVNVFAIGRKNSKQIYELLMDASAYVHLAYIENSSNSICEAQISGIPVIATHVGGTASLIESGKTGILVPVNEPSMVATAIIRIHQEESFATSIGRNGHLVAKKRHNSTAIVQNLVEIYREILAIEKQ